MIRAIFDANVFAASLVGFRRAESTPGALLRHWLLVRDFELVTAGHLVAEIDRALMKPYFFTRVASADRRLAEDALHQQASWTGVTIAVDGVATHPEDDIVLAAAVSAGVDYLVPGDKQLQQLGKYEGVTIVSPREFLTLLESDQPSRLDPLPILTTLGLDSPKLVEPVRGGADAAIWRVEHGGETYALRVLRPDQAGQARREIASMTAAATGGVAVPRVVATAAWQARPVLLLEWAPGRTLAETLLSDLGNLERAHAVGVDFGRVQAAIHSLAAPSDLPDLAVVWQRWIGPDLELAGLLDRIPPRPPALLHLDYHPLNVLVEGDRVSAVLDWANACAGDPRADLARTLSIGWLAPIPKEAGEAGRRALRAFEAGWRRGYEASAGPIGDLSPFLWWAGAVMERELTPRLGRADLPWLTPEHLGRIRRWTARQRQSVR